MGEALGRPNTDRFPDEATLLAAIPREKGARPSSTTDGARRSPSRRPHDESAESAGIEMKTTHEQSRTTHGGRTVNGDQERVERRVSRGEQRVKRWAAQAPIGFQMRRRSSRPSQE